MAIWRENEEPTSKMEKSATNLKKIPLDDSSFRSTTNLSYHVVESK